MGTNYSDLYPEVRAACGDFGVIKSGSTVDETTYVFRDGMINSVLTLILYDIADYDKVSGSNAIDQDFADDNDRLLVVLSAALLLLVSFADEAFASGDVRFSRQAPSNQLAWVALKLSKAQNINKLPIATDGSTTAIINMATRWADQLAGAVESTEEVMEAYTSSFTSQTSVTVAHALGYKPVVWVEDTNGNEIDAEVQHTSSDSFTVTFASSQSGTVHYR